MDTIKPQLDYAPPIRWHRRRITHRVIVVTALLATVGITAYWRRPLAARSRLLYWQHQCMIYTLAADQIAYETDPQAAARLAELPEYERAIRWSAYLSVPNNLPPEPIANLRPTCWRRYVQCRPKVNDIGGAVVFLHRLQSKGGNTRLVVVAPWGVSLYTMELHADVFEPKGVFSKSDPPPPPSGGGLFGGSADDPPADPKDWVLKTPLDEVRLWAGRADTRDASHFSVRYGIAGKTGTIDGWLQDDDTVTFANRNAEFSTTRPTHQQIFDEYDMSRFRGPQ